MLTKPNMINSIIQNLICLVKLISPEVWIALFSFLVAFITLWVTLISPARISAKIGNTIAVYFANLKKEERDRSLLSICLPLAIVNKGAKTGLIENIALKVKFGTDTTSYLYKVSREISEIQVYANNGQIDTGKMQSNVKDPFTTVILIGKSLLQKNYIFWPANEEELSIQLEPPFPIQIELFLQKKGKWKKQGEISFTNPAVNIKNKTGFAIIESDESLKSIEQLNS